MVRGGMLAGLATVPVAGGVALLARGGSGALGAVVALGLILANFAVAGLALAWAARRTAVLFPAVAMPSYVLRMIGLLVAMKYLKGAAFIDHPTFAVTFGVGVVALLAFECRLYARTPWLALAFSTTKETT